MKITGENTFNRDDFGTEGNHQVTMRKPCFGYFFRFGTYALTLRPQNMYIYIFPAFFGFCNF